MVQTSIPLQTQGNLRRQGYRLEPTFGWDTHEVPLYVHRDGAVKPLGSVGIKMRIGNLKALDRAEAMYLANKGAAGFFMWPPEECFEHEFTPVEYVSRPGGGMVERRSSEKLMGCKWCRARTSTGLQGDAGTSSISAVESTARTTEPAPPAVTTDTASVTDGTFTESVLSELVCSVCDYVPREQTKAGKPMTLKRRQHALKLNKKRHAS